MITFIIRWVEERLPEFTKYRTGLAGLVILAITILSDLILILINSLGFISPYMSIFFLLLSGIMILVGAWLCYVAIKFKREKKPLPDAQKLTINLSHPLGRAKLLLFTISAGIGFTLVSYTGTTLVHYTESNSFCTDLCHKVMEPEGVTHANSSHSRVDCVSCHVESGTAPFFKAKLSGVYRLYAVLTHSYDTPIHEIPRQLRPVRRTCENCHWTDTFKGDKILSTIKYEKDMKNTPLYNTILLHVGASPLSKGIVSGVHGHMRDENRVTFKTAEDNTIVSVEIFNKRINQSIVYKLPDYPEKYSGQKIESNEMSCYDCHNRIAHYHSTPEKEINKALSLGTIDPSIPWIRKYSEVLITNLPLEKHSREEIRKKLMELYLKEKPDIAKKWAAKIDKSADAIYDILKNRIFPDMKVSWDSYPSYAGHWEAEGCFRCHNDSLETSSGKTISSDCELCHTILAEDAPKPYRVTGK